MPQANDAQDKVRDLQIKLYLAAKRSPTRRFHALYDKVHRRDVLERAWREVEENHGTAGVDGVSIEAIQEGGVEAWLECWWGEAYCTLKLGLRRAG
jgi:RNA-directed DNA polymerase